MSNTTTDATRTIPENRVRPSMDPIPSPSELQAARWVVRLEDGSLTAEERRALEVWLAAASHHRGALIRAGAVWSDLDRLGALTQSG